MSLTVWKYRHSSCITSTRIVQTDRERAHRGPWLQDIPGEQRRHVLRTSLFCLDREWARGSPGAGPLVALQFRLWVHSNPPHGVLQAARLVEVLAASLQVPDSSVSVAHLGQPTVK